MEVEAPETITATGGRYALADNGETPDTLEVVYHYEKGGKDFLMVWSHTDANTHGLEDMGQGIMFQGTDATLVANYNTYKIIPAKGRRRSPDVPKTLPRSVGHHREWLNAIKTAGPVLVQLRLRPPAQLRRPPRQHRPLDRREAEVGRRGRADHQPPGRQPVPHQGIPQALGLAGSLTIVG